ncbi:MAG: hypothetical protein VST68_11615 [Nitrospirota bacterium]|nr:hypothetical protein [Nitrospirota bacterium]
MGGKRFTPEDSIGHLRTVEIEFGKGVSAPDACRKLSICEQTYSGGNGNMETCAWIKRNA